MGSSTTLKEANSSGSRPLQLNLKDHCLFCLEPQVQSEMIELIKSNPKKILSFQPILHYLIGTDPTYDKGDCGNDKRGVPLMRNLPPLCNSCYDKVAELNRLHKQLMDVQHLIKKQVEGVREVVKKARAPPAMKSPRIKFFAKLGGGRIIATEEYTIARKFVEGLHTAIIGDDSRTMLFPSKLPPNYIPSASCPNTRSIHRVIIRNLHPTRAQSRSIPRKSSVAESGVPSPAGITSIDSPLNDDEEGMVQSGMEAEAGPPEAKGKRKYVYRRRERKRKRKRSSRDMDEDSPAQACDLCGEMFPCSEIINHLTTHVKDYVTKCINPSCPYAFSCPLSMEKHVKSRGLKNKCGTAASIPPGLWIRKCEVCDFQTDLLLEYKNHLDWHEVQVEEKEFDCPIPNCPEKFAFRQAVHVHISHHDLRQPQNIDNIEAQQCPICKELTSIAEIKSHLKLAHQVEEIFSCEECPFVFHNKEVLLKHSSKHKTDRTFSCSICEGVKFQSSEILRQHNRNVHGISRVLLCNMCGKKFCNTAGLSTHKRHMHFASYQEELSKRKYGQRQQNKKYYQCELCTDVTKFSCNAHLLTHKIRVHGMDPMACKYCDQIFTSIPILKIHERGHIRRQDSETFPCAVENCDKVFLSQSSLSSHERRVHENESTHPCSLCGKTYKNASSLGRHRQSVHLGIRHVCDVCGASFVQKHMLATHMLIHDSTTGDGEKEEGNSHDSTVDNDKGHSHAPTGDKNKGHSHAPTGDKDKGHSQDSTGNKDTGHSCPVCNKTFLYKSFLRNHLKSQHKEMSNEGESTATGE